MATPVIMPRQGQSVESCIIAKWHKSKGDKVEVGDILFSYETDKANFEEESKVSGVFLEAFFEEGDDVPCLLNVCVIGNEGEDTAAFNPNQVNSSDTLMVDENIKGKSEEIKPDISENIVPIQINDEEIIKISPRARNLAENSGIDYRYANPSGPYGRIIEKDILELKKNGMVFTASAKNEHTTSQIDNSIVGTGLGGRITTEDLKNLSTVSESVPKESTVNIPSQPTFEEVKISNIRKVIAKSMQHSLSSTAQLTLNSSFDASGVLEFRKNIKSGKAALGLEDITINDIIIYAVSRTLPDHKSLNAHFLDDKMLCFTNVNLGIAVDTDRGLMVPTLFNANLKSLNEISKEVKQLVNDCKSGSINPDLLKNAGFTITNLGTLGIESFTPVLNPPQTGILGVNTIVQRAKEEDGEIIFYPAMGLSLTFDHKALDGAPAAKFLQDLKKNLESFSLLLAK